MLLRHSRFASPGRQGRKTRALHDILKGWWFGLKAATTKGMPTTTIGLF